MIRSPFYLAVLLAAAFAAYGANASAQDRVPAQVTMKFSAADQRDARTLTNRLNAAAKLVCDSDMVADPKTAEADRACEQQAVNDALRDLNRTQVAQKKTSDGASQSSMTFADVAPAN